MNDITQLSTLYSNAIARAEKAEEALRTVQAERKLLTHIRACGDTDSVEYSYKVCATGDDGAIPVYLGPHAHIAASYDMVTLLQGAIEGECDGLSIDERQAVSILSYVFAAPPPPVRETP